MGSLPNTIPYIGYDGAKVDGSLRVEEFHLPIPTPADDQVLIHVTNSSINPLGRYDAPNRNETNRLDNAMIAGIGVSNIVSELFYTLPPSIDTVQYSTVH
jgi:NADPH:quinone reductase-like Zn-dependent oxidoreductase